MSECRDVRERMSQLLDESLEPSIWEGTHQHIEQCAECASEWSDFQTTWRTLGDLPDLPVPGALRDRFLSYADEQSMNRGGKIVPLRRPQTGRWLAQAAALAVLVGGSFYAGRQMTSPTPATEQASRPLEFAIAESMVLPASQVSPEIEGRPDIQNVRFENQGGEVGLSFDITSHMTITGRRDDKSLVKLLAYLVQNQDNSTNSRSTAIQWVKDNYASPETTEPEIIQALANVLKNDTHEGVRIKAVEALRAMPASLAPDARDALIDALKNDPNPAVRIKAIEALANLASEQKMLDRVTVDTLRETASQDDENTYVRVKAAEALSQIDL